jgi:FkbM family methyltransferase
MINQNAITNQPAALTRMMSRAVQSYTAHFPVEKGKYWLRAQAAARFLVGQIDHGLWIRISGASGFEWAVFLRKPKEEKTKEVIEALLAPGMTFFDVGSNIGYYALIGSLCVQGGHVHAFEPTPELAERIRENTRLNGLSNITVNQAGVSDHDGEMDLHLCQDDSEGNSLVAFQEDWPTVRVPLAKLDSYVHQHAISQVDLIKLDCEGAEYSVLRGSRAVLSREQAPIVIMEFNPDTMRASQTDVPEMLAYLAELGYSVYSLEKLKSSTDSVYNLILVKKAHLEKYPLLQTYCQKHFTGSEHE